MNRIHPAAAAGFSRAAEVYERARPSYPEEAIAWAAERTGLGPGATVADVAAGTGKLTRLLVATGARVVAVEPVAEMRALIQGVEVLDGIAEALPLASASVDVVTVAQAFHWFDFDAALPELHRVLRPGGHLAVFWNLRDLDDSLQHDVEELLRPLRRSAVAWRESGWREALAASPLFGAVQEREFANEQRLTVEGLCERVASTSFVASMPARGREELLDRIRALAAGREEPFSFPYRTEVHVVLRAEGPTAGPGPGTSAQG